MNIFKKALIVALSVGLISVPTVTKEVEAATPTTLYLTPNSNWTQANARFAAYFFGNGEKWVSMTDEDMDLVYEVTVPSGFSKVIFCRMNPSTTANNWNNKWNQTGDLTIPTDGKNHFVMPSGAWDGSTSTWSTYTIGETINGGTPFYLNVGSNLWGSDNAWFSAHFYNSNDDVMDVSFVNLGDCYGVVAPTGSWEKVIFCRMNPIKKVFDWDYVWNQTSGLLWDGENNYYTITGWDANAGKWSKYSGKYKVAGQGFYKESEPKGQLSLAYSYNEEDNSITSIDRVGVRLGSGPIVKEDIFVGVEPTEYVVKVNEKSYSLTSENVGKVNANGDYDENGNYIQWSLAVNNIPADKYGYLFNVTTSFKVGDVEYNLGSRNCSVKSLAESYKGQDLTSYGAHLSNALDAIIAAA